MDSRVDATKRSINQHKAYRAMRAGLVAMTANTPRHWDIGRETSGDMFKLNKEGLEWSLANKLVQTSLWMSTTVKEFRHNLRNMDGRTFLQKEYDGSVAAFRAAITICKAKHAPIITVHDYMSLKRTVVMCQARSREVNAYISPAWLAMVNKLGSEHADRRYVVLSAARAFQANGFDIFSASVFDTRAVRCLDGYLGRYKQDGEPIRLVYHESPTRCVTKLTNMVAKMAFEKMMPG